LTAMSPANAFHEVATKVFKNTLYIDVPLSVSPK